MKKRIKDFLEKIWFKAIGINLVSEPIEIFSRVEISNQEKRIRFSIECIIISDIYFNDSLTEAIELTQFIIKEVNFKRKIKVNPKWSHSLN